LTAKKSVLVSIGLLVSALALIAAGCGGGDGGGAPEALPSSSCTAIEYGGEGDPDYILASDFPLQGSSRTQTEQIVAAIKFQLEQQDYKAGDYNIGFQSCDDATAQAGKWDSGKCSANANAYAANDAVIGVIGTFNSGCAAIEIPVLNQAPDGGIAMISPANTYVCLTAAAPSCDSTEPDKYYPSGTRNYAARRRERRVPGCRGCRVRAEPGRQERLHPERQGGLRPRRRDELPRRSGVARHQDRGLRGLGSEGDELHVALRQDRSDRCATPCSSAASSTRTAPS
jgi:hypothetical protein